MALRPKNRPSTDFSLASISDIVFLLLIFFMLTSSFVQQGVKVDLPTGSSRKPSKGQITITVTKDHEFFWNSDKIDKEEIRNKLSQAVDKDPQNKVVTLRTDKETVMEDAAFVINAVAEIGGAVVIATKRK
jgi:biopolymer transport protein ExbD